MPVIYSGINMPLVFQQGDISTLYSSLFRKVTGIKYNRKTLNLKDGDFIDLDFSIVNSSKICIVLHGLEGNSKRPYIQGVVKKFNENNWDCVSINFRGCSGRDNKLLRSYHSGVSEDLEEVIQEIESFKVYNSICIIGFSLGGNVMLKYLGERGSSISSKITCGVAISVPCELKTACEEIMKPRNVIYEYSFVKSLKQKIYEKANKFPGSIDFNKIKEIKKIIDIDDVYTAPIHGFSDVYQYYEKCSSKNYLTSIKVPTLIINAENDFFLSKECYPIEVAKHSKNIYLEIPKYGGHVGFYQKEKYYWNEFRAFEFVAKHS